MIHRVTLLPHHHILEISDGQNLLIALRDAGVLQDAPCGGKGRCGKCHVTVDGTEVLACRTIVDRDFTVTLPTSPDQKHRILSDGTSFLHTADPIKSGYLLAFDIGTTTVVGFLLDGKTGEELACESSLNPQTTFGADVISRIQAALNGHLNELSSLIRTCINEMIKSLCHRVRISPADVSIISLVGNPAMQQLFFEISPQNLAQIPFSPVLTELKIVPAKDYLPICTQADLIIVPDISGFVGADTLAGVLATQMDRQDEITLLVDIGTNGEMVLGNRERMVCCSTAAGPALEGANIRFGMRGMRGAIDHVRIEDGQLTCSVIGETAPSLAAGICGSGLIDAVAVALDRGLISSRGRIQTPDRTLQLTGRVYLTQEDIREVQMAKGAIAAGIELMTAHLGLTLQEIDRVYLAGAFGTFMDPGSACRIGLLPPVLQDKLTVIGNAAGSGAKLLACDKAALHHVQKLSTQIEFLELAAVPGFQRCFAEQMRFEPRISPARFPR